MPEGDAELEFLRQFLADRDAPCPGCQYNLRALTTGICPECGEKVVVRVAMAEPKLAAMIAGLIGLSVGAGFNGLLLVYVFIMYFRGMGPSDPIWRAFTLINGAGLIVLGSGIIVWLRKWSMIRSQSAMVRWSLVAVCWLLSFADVMIFSFTIR